MTDWLEETFPVRFCETDALGHVSNTVIASWFESARLPIFRVFSPSLDVKNWPLILAKYNLNFHAQLFYGQQVTVKTGVSKIGNSSFDTYQEVWQNDVLCVSGTTTMVQFDYSAQRSKAISNDLKEALKKWWVNLPTK